MLFRSQDFRLYQNFPNPFNPATKICFDLPKDSDVRIAVCDLLGKEIATLINEHKPAGTYTIEFDASRLSSGLYVAKMFAGIETKFQKMVLLK